MVKVFLAFLSKIPFFLEDARSDLVHNEKFYEYLLHGHQEEDVN